MAQHECYDRRMLPRRQRHAWRQVAFVTAILALLMATDQNGDPFARAIIGVAAFAAFVYAVLRLWGVTIRVSNGTQPTEQSRGAP